MQHVVKYIDRGTEHVGTFRVDGWMLELTCPYGSCRAALGLFEPKVLARKLLRHLVAKGARRSLPQVARETPHPALIEAAKPAAARPALLKV